MSLRHHELEQRIDEAVHGARARSDDLDADLKRELTFAASRGPEALEGLLACLDPGQRHAAFAFLHSEEGNHATSRSLGRMSDEEANYRARREALDRTPVMEPKAAVVEVTRRAHEAVGANTAVAPSAPVEEAAAVPVTGEESEAEQDHVDNVLAREAHFAKKWEGNDLLAKALARHRSRKG